MSDCDELITLRLEAAPTSSNDLILFLPIPALPSPITVTRTQQIGGASWPSGSALAHGPDGPGSIPGPAGRKI